MVSRTGAAGRQAGSDMRLADIRMAPIVTAVNAMKARTRWTMPLPCCGVPSMSSAKNASSPEQTAQVTSRAKPPRVRPSRRTTRYRAAAMASDSAQRSRKFRSITQNHGPRP
jgi:hypothetical protein